MVVAEERGKRLFIKNTGPCENVEVEVYGLTPAGVEAPVLRRRQRRVVEYRLSRRAYGGGATAVGGDGA